MKILKHIFSLQNIFISLGISFLYFFIRLYQLKSLPIFLDELTYGRWAQLGQYDATQRFASLGDGKQPLFIWLSSIVMNIISNPILAGRSVSILVGFLTLIGLGALSYELFKNKWGVIITCFVYALYPFALIVNRLGTYESLVGMLLVWSIYIEILLVRYLRLDIALILGFFFGANLLTKTSGLQVLYLLPLSFLLNTFGKKKLIIVGKWVGLSLVAVCIGYLLSSILFLSPNRYMIEEKNYIFIYHFAELIPYHAFSLWVPNLMLFAQWLFLYITVPLLILIFVSLGGNKQYRKEKLFLLLWFVIPVLYLGLFGRLLYVRYLYAMTLPLLPLIGYGMVILSQRIKNKIVYLFLFLLLISQAVFTDVKILTDLSHAPLPRESLFELVNGWPSGQGLHEIVTYLTDKSTSSKIFVGTEGKYGSLPTLAMEMYFVNNPNVERGAFEPLDTNASAYLAKKAEEMPTFMIFNTTQKIPNWPMNLVFEQKKGTSNYFIRLYKIKSSLTQE